MEAVTTVISSGNLTMRWGKWLRIIVWKCVRLVFFFLGILCLYAGKVWGMSSRLLRKNFLKSELKINVEK